MKKSANTKFINAKSAKSETENNSNSKKNSDKKENIFRSKFLPIFGWLIWTMFAFFAAYLIISFVIIALKIDVNKMNVLGNSIINAITYLLILFIAIAIPLFRVEKIDKNQKIQKNNKLRRCENLKILGLNRLPKWSDFGFTLSNIPVFYILLMAISILSMFVFGPEIMNQEQTLNYATENNVLWQLIIIGLSLAFVAPIAEEILFRGFLFTKIREILKVKISNEKTAQQDKIGFWTSSIIVSLLFALTHMQINVGIMTFLLSMFACRMREKTGAIWAGIGLHMTVNFVAFCALFLVK